MTSGVSTAIRHKENKIEAGGFRVLGEVDEDMMRVERFYRLKMGVFARMAAAATSWTRKQAGV